MAEEGARDIHAQRPHRHSIRHVAGDGVGAVGSEFVQLWDNLDLGP